MVQNHAGTAIPVPDALFTERVDALGLWQALPQAYGQTRRQRCWVHKTGNVLDKLPKDIQPQAKQRPQALWMAPDRARAERACDLLLATYEQP